MDHIPLKIKWFKGLKNYELYKDKPKTKLWVFAFYVEYTSDLKAYVPVLASGNFSPIWNSPSVLMSPEHPRELPGLYSPFKVQNSSPSYFLSSLFERRTEQLHISVECPHGLSLEACFFHLLLFVPISKSLSAFSFFLALLIVCTFLALLHKWFLSFSLGLSIRWIDLHIFGQRWVKSSFKQTADVDPNCTLWLQTVWNVLYVKRLSVIFQIFFLICVLIAMTRHSWRGLFSFFFFFHKKNWCLQEILSFPWFQ